MKTPEVKAVFLGIILGLGFLVAAGFASRATEEDPPLVPPDQVPANGNFYSVQRPGYPPLPVNPFPDLPVYDLGNNWFLVDDTAVDYTALASSMGASPQEDNPQEPSGAPFSYGCGEFWLEIAPTNGAAVLLTLRNTHPGHTYTIWSLTDLGQTNWVAETNLTGAAGDFTQTAIPMGQRTNLFFRASEARVYAVDTSASFRGMNNEDTGAPDPDTMGAMGPNHFVELLNYRIAVFDKSNGSRLQMTNTQAFFNVDGTNSTIDGRILYDHQEGRWVACGLDVRGSKELMLAVSKTSDPTNLVDNWDKYLIQVARTNADSDYATMGLDDNGIYISVAHRSSGTNAGFTVIAIKKQEIYTNTLVYTYLPVGTNEVVTWCIQPAVNFDSPPAGGYAWFVAKGPPDLGPTYRGGAVFYRRLEWVGTNARWETNSGWRDLTNAPNSYREYYDFDGSNVLQKWSIAGPTAPQTNGIGINLMVVGSRLMMATLRNGCLWTCHHVGLEGTDGTYTNGPAGATVNRSAAQWLKLRLNSDATTLDYDEHGRIYDRAASNAYWYYFPSLAVNCAGDMVAGFSGSSASTHIGAFCTWRLSNGYSPPNPLILQQGSAVYPHDSWGDYSATTIDPTDDWSFWTVQEYADLEGQQDRPWVTWIARITCCPYPP